MSSQLFCHLEKEIKLKLFNSLQQHKFHMEQRFKCNDEAIKILGENMGQSQSGETVLSMT